MTAIRPTPGRSGADNQPAPMMPAGRWLMLVRTRSTDSAKEAQFNEWYDRVDIPDVLEVPGYLRARRGLAQPLAGHSGDEDGKYVALYDISSGAIDKTIIDMLMATRKMEQRGRSTDLLEVTERIYYRQYAPSQAARTEPASGGPLYLFLERFDTRTESEEMFDDWYEESYRRVLADATGVIRATRYELYRVLMIEPKIIPRFLTVYEISAQSPEQARTALGEASRGWRGATRAHPGYLAGDATLFLEIRNEVRQ